MAITAVVCRSLSLDLFTMDSLYLLINSMEGVFQRFKAELVFVIYLMYKNFNIKLYGKY